MSTSMERTPQFLDQPYDSGDSKESDGPRETASILQGARPSRAGGEGQQQRGSTASCLTVFLMIMILMVMVIYC